MWRPVVPGRPLGNYTPLICRPIARRCQPDSRDTGLGEAYVAVRECRSIQKKRPYLNAYAPVPSPARAGEGWSFYICATARMDGERMRNANFLPSPLWGRGWTASGVLISRGGTGEGVETVSSPHPYRKTRSLARTGGQIDKARELRRHGSRSARVVCGKSGGHGMVDSGSMWLSRLAF